MSKIAAKRIVSFESPGMRRVLRILGEATEPMDGRTIADKACIAFLTFTNTYRHLLLRANLMHISGWKHNTRGPFVPLYSKGPLVGDIPEKPKNIESKVRARAWKERTGYYEAEKAKRRLARPPDPALAALMGLTARYHKTSTTPASPAERNAA